MASFVGPKTVVVNGVEYTADHINIAVGGRPVMPDVPGVEFCIDRQEKKGAFSCRFFILFLSCRFHEYNCCRFCFYSFFLACCCCCLSSFLLYIFICVCVFSSESCFLFLLWNVLFRYVFVVGCLSFICFLFLFFGRLIRPYHVHTRCVLRKYQYQYQYAPLSKPTRFLYRYVLLLSVPLNTSTYALLFVNSNTHYTAVVKTIISYQYVLLLSKRRPIPRINTHYCCQNAKNNSSTSYISIHTYYRCRDVKTNTYFINIIRTTVSNTTIILLRRTIRVNRTKYCW